MAKTKLPILSLGAHGTIGETLTYQKRQDHTIVRKKPIPIQPNTLPQMYQRWLYEDYVYLWHQQSVATKQEYASAGVRFHLTGFQYWMKYHLTNLPDIALWYKLDDMSGATTPDSSRNGLTGTIFGATAATLRIDGAAYLDGVNDYISIGRPSQLEYMSAKTVEFFIYPPAFTANEQTIYYGGYWDPPYGDWVFIDDDFQRIRVNLRNPAGGVSSRAWALPTGFIYHIAYTWDGTRLRAYRDGVEPVTSIAFAGPLAGTGFDQCVGGRKTSYDGKGIIDNFIIWNRALDQPTLLRHSQRRYPL